MTANDGEARASRRGGRRRRWALLLIVLALPIVLCSRPWSNPGPDLRGLAEPDDDMVLHVANTAAAWEDGDGWYAAVVADDEVGRRWPALVSAAADQAAAVTRTLGRLSPGDSPWMRALHGELLVVARLRGSDRVATPPSLWGGDPRQAFPFLDLTVVLRPRDRRAMVALRAALSSWCFDRWVRPRLPPDTSLVDDVVLIRDVEALAGARLFRDRRPPPCLAIACGEDRIVAGLDVERVRRLATAVPASVAGSAPAATLRLSASVRGASSRLLDERIAGGVAQSLRALTGVPLDGDVLVTLDDRGVDSVLEARWLDDVAATTTAEVAANGAPALVVADGARAGAAILDAVRRRSWISPAARRILGEAAGPLAVTVTGADGRDAVLGLTPAAVRTGAPPARLRFCARGEALRAWLASTAAARRRRATTPPPRLAAAAREGIVEELARATAKNELEPRRFEEIVAGRHGAWAAEWERRGLESWGLALGELFDAILGVTGSIEGGVFPEDGEAVFRVRVRR